MVLVLIIQEKVVTESTESSELLVIWSSKGVDGVQDTLPQATEP